MIKMMAWCDCEIPNILYILKRKRVRKTEKNMVALTNNVAVRRGGGGLIWADRIGSEVVGQSPIIFLITKLTIQLTNPHLSEWWGLFVVVVARKWGGRIFGRRGRIFGGRIRVLKP